MRDNRDNQPAFTSQCVVCREPDSDFFLVQPKAHGGTHDAWNLVPLCWEHMREQRALGWNTFSFRYLDVRLYMERNGWEFVDRAAGSFLRQKGSPVMTVVSPPLPPGLN